jgi:hypothetical protein
MYKLCEKDETFSALFKNMLWNYMHKDIVSFGIRFVTSKHDTILLELLAIYFCKLKES